MSAVFATGQLVSATAGRDKGSVYMVVGQISPTMVLVADGRNRPLAHPKRKNIRHLKSLRPSIKTANCEPSVSERLTDEVIRQVINQFVPDNI